MDQKSFQAVVIGLLGIGVAVLIGQAVRDNADRPTKTQVLQERAQQQVDRVDRLLNR